MHGQLLLLAKTKLGLENIASARIEEETGFKTASKPGGFPGIIEVYGPGDPDQALKTVLDRVQEVESAVPAHGVCGSRGLEELVECAYDAIKGRLDVNHTFAVRCTRRGVQAYTSLDVNYALGAKIVGSLGLKVDLDNPDYVVYVEIVGDHAVVGVLPGHSLRRKMTPEKTGVHEFMWRISVAQIPYVDDPQATRLMGEKIGRGVQTFEVGEYIIAPIKPVNAYALASFIDGVRKGIRTRLEVQKKSYSRHVHETRVVVQDMYQLVRDRGNEPIVIFEPEGRPIDRISDELADVIMRNQRVNMLFGAREGVPSGLFRYADLVVDLAPGITLATEFAVPSALIMVAYLIERRVRLSTD